MSASKPAPPKGTKAAGRRLWRAVLADFELTEAELSLLREACRTVDLCDTLDAIVDAEGPLLASPQGVKAHPAVVEARQQRIALARLLAALRVPGGVDDENRPQRRSGPRGPYNLRPVS